MLGLIGGLIGAGFGVAVAIFAIYTSLKDGGNKSFNLSFKGEVSKGDSEFVVINHEDYKKFANENNYLYDSASNKNMMCNNTHNKKCEAGNIDIEINLDKYVRNYANFNHFPFNQGNSKKVTDLIKGNYKGFNFVVFNYVCNVRNMNNNFSNKTFATYYIEVDDAPILASEADDIFFDQNRLCIYEEGYVDINKIHSHLDMLIAMYNGN